MSKRVTTTEFIERAKAVHGDRYDYSHAVYQGIHQYVTIVCPEHGPFKQTPGNHYYGKGCSDCGGSKPHTTESFIEAAREVHGETYDYSLVEYSSNKAHITIICSDHGPFSQIAAVHLRGNGCPKCGGNLKHSKKSFIEKAQSVHGDRFDYSQVEYKNAHAKVTINCPDHGPFEQSPSNHFAGKACDECAVIATSNAKRSNTEDFISKARMTHAERYDYSQVEYVSSSEKVTIICSDHGLFEQTPNEHLMGSGCDKCGILSRAEARRKTTEQFIADAHDVHGDRYDYLLVEYQSAKEKVTIICPEHGAFEQTPSGHLGGKGCFDCAETGFNPDKPALLYYLAVTTDEGGTRYKIGITNRSVDERFRSADLARIRIVKIWYFEVGRDAAERESEVLHQYVRDRYYGPDLLVSAGNTELFTHDILGLDSGDYAPDQSAVDEDAVLISRLRQTRLDF